MGQKRPGSLCNAGTSGFVFINFQATNYGTSSGEDEGKTIKTWKKRMNCRWKSFGGGRMHVFEKKMRMKTTWLELGPQNTYSWRHLMTEYGTALCKVSHHPLHRAQPKRGPRSSYVVIVLVFIWLAQQARGVRITTLLLRTCNLTTIACGRWSLVTN